MGVWFGVCLGWCITVVCVCDVAGIRLYYVICSVVIGVA